ncbi:MAG: alpha-amylase family glycosyl hydrolase [Coprothermobacterota bacterium]|nr:alpha-amylase family glycosyl hydrolase [Coprothermobacterota bacterium]
MSDDRNEFRISRRARLRYGFEKGLFTPTGKIAADTPLAARSLARRIDEVRNTKLFPERSVRAGEINAFGLLAGALHAVIRLYRQAVVPDPFFTALNSLKDHLGKQSIDLLIQRYKEEFFPVTQLQPQPQTVTDLPDEGDPGIALEELILLWLDNANPALASFHDLFGGSELQGTAYDEAIATLQTIFPRLPPFGPDQQDLLTMLRSPAVASPRSLAGQLDYIRRHWGLLLGKSLYRLLSGLDLLAEEERALALSLGGPGSEVGGGAGPGRPPDYSLLQGEPEAFSPDRQWMPRLVLLSKNTYVWLEQLSRQYGRLIHHLDEIPDEELELIARRGFTGLWLIGVWERSSASAEIKRLCGNPGAAASAYSLYDYTIAQRIGGEAALAGLRQRASAYGIRLASDMVPNHMGIDSRWVMEHPDYFLALPECPYPAYSFNGPDLSGDPRTAICLEDHYYSRQDAAVVFLRKDRETGEQRYFYHGNDGTNMPWNDTAQLDYTNPETREAVIHSILEVAKRFPVIRFDAAMTLARKHFQRLWFPEPGSGGGIPSRWEHGLTKAQFDQLMPAEFWREVVDRVSREAPDTLLLAEAFWLMEGYFVRTLGMHRVYNSAFMHMLRDEDNAGYRQVMKETLAFDPEVLRRFVNFLSNPDERTAVDQFGKGDKYLGACTLLATLPGLPMFGHGQVEGFEEKYGMEYERPMRQEEADPALVAAHEREIFPLLHRRSLFAGVEHFLLYDFRTPGGENDENVFAYSNGYESERVLIVYHNRFATTRGAIRDSVPFLERDSEGGRRLRASSLAAWLGLDEDPDGYCLFRDATQGLEYILPCPLLWKEWLFLELEAYQRHLFQDFRQVREAPNRPYRELAASLAGRGVPSLEEAIIELLRKPLQYSLRSLLEADLVRRLLAHQEEEETIFSDLESKLERFLTEVASAAEVQTDLSPLIEQVLHEVRQIRLLPSLIQALLAHAFPGAELLPDQEEWPRRGAILLTCALLRPLGNLSTVEQAANLGRDRLEAWRLSGSLEEALVNLGFPMQDAALGSAIVRMELSLRFTLHAHQRDALFAATEAVHRLFADGEARRWLGVHRWNGILWFSREGFTEAVRWLLASALVATLETSPCKEEEGAATAIAFMPALERSEGLADIKEWLAIAAWLRAAAEDSGYQVEKLLDILQNPQSPITLTSSPALQARQISPPEEISS